MYVAPGRVRPELRNSSMKRQRKPGQRTGAGLDPPGRSQLAGAVTKKMQPEMASAVPPCGDASSGLEPPLAAWCHRGRWPPPELGCPLLCPPPETAGGCMWLLQPLAFPTQVKKYSVFVLFHSLLFILVCFHLCTVLVLYMLHRVCNKAD